MKNAFVISLMLSQFSGFLLADDRLTKDALISVIAQQKLNRKAVQISIPAFSIRFDQEGRPVSLFDFRTNHERIFQRRSSEGFSLTYRDAGGQVHRKRMTSLALSGDLLVGEQDGIIIAARVSPQSDYLTLRLVAIEEPADKKLLHLSFDIKVDGPSQMRPLDYMTTVRTHGVERTAMWNWIWGRSEHNPLGAFAFYLPKDENEDDEILLRLWVHEGLPHPKIEGAWTLDRARNWLVGWQTEFVDQSTMVIQPTNEKELHLLSEVARRLGMKKVYLHTDTWRGEYWPVNNSFLHVRRDIFPEGENSLRQYADFLRDQGLSIGLHTVSCAIARHDPDYVAEGIDDRLAWWVEGTLVKALDENADTFLLKPHPGSIYPREIGHEVATPNTRPRFLNIQCFQIGDELVEARQHEIRKDGIWVFKRCVRSLYGTPRQPHAKGSNVRGLYRPYGQVFCADPDSTLLPEMTTRFADFCNQNNINHLECDALENHQSKPWGSRKFSWLLYEGIDHPCTSNTSSGSPLPFHVEYWFNSSKKVLRNHPTGGVAGGDGIPLYLDHEDRPATGPLEIHLKPTQRVGIGGTTINLIRPVPMFGVSYEAMKLHGLRGYITEAIRGWKQAVPRFSQPQRDDIAKHFEAYRSPLGEARNQLASDVLYRPFRTREGALKMQPFQVMHPVSGGLNWGWGQEFGPLVPRVYCQMNKESLSLINPYRAQEPEFVLRVLPSFEQQDQRIDHSFSLEKTQKSMSSIAEQYNLGAGQGEANHPLSHAEQIGVIENLQDGKPKDRPAKFYLRKAFTIEKLAPITLASLFFHANRHTEVFLNGQQVHVGAHPRRTLMVDLTNRLVEGENTIAIGIPSGSAETAFCAAILIDRNGSQQWIGTDQTWLSSARQNHEWKSKELDTSDWEPAVTLGQYGTSPVGRAPVFPVTVTRDLMPKSIAQIKRQGDHQFSLADGKLSVSSTNRSDQEKFTTDDRPWWPTSSSMHRARGLALTVTGDNSGAVLVISIDGRSRRDYVVPIDFSGKRDIVIPHGEVAWSDPHWGWRGRTARFNYGIVYGVELGFGKIPPASNPEVTIENLRIVEEKKVAVDDLTITLGDNEGTWQARGRVVTEQYLWYRGGDTVGIYDLNWNKLKELPVKKTNFQVPPGPQTIFVSGTGASPHIEAQFVVTDQLIELTTDATPQ